MMLVLLGLIARAVSIEARNRGQSPAWRRFFDCSFAFGSTLVALLLGVAVGNLMRGLPLDARGEYAEPSGPCSIPFRYSSGRPRWPCLPCKEPAGWP